jgi:hypothetical protein
MKFSLAEVKAAAGIAEWGRRRKWIYFDINTSSPDVDLRLR